MSAAPPAEAVEIVLAFTSVDEYRAMGHDIDTARSALELPIWATPTEVIAAVLWQCAPRSDTQFCRKILDEDGHRIRPQQHPEQLVAKTRSAIEVRAEIAWIDIGDAGNEGRSEVVPQL